jgi:hypothetical protein
LRTIGWHLLAAVCLLHLAISPCAAATQADWDSCTSQDLDKNIPACTRIIDDPGTSEADRVDAYVWRGGHYVTQNSFVSAIRDYTSALKISPKNITALGGRAIANFRKGDRDQAIMDYSVAKRLEARQVDTMAAGSEDLKAVAGLAAQAPPPAAQLDALVDALIPKVPTCQYGMRPEGSTCVAITCPTGQRLDGATCVPVVCGSGTKLEGNSCVAIGCPPGQKLDGAACVPIVCGTGMKLEGSRCVAINCPSGYRLDGSSCVQIVCGPGETLEGGVCTSANKFIAIAIGETDHLAYGASYDRGTMEGAKDDAMSRCRNQLPSGKCKIVLSGEAACIALYWTPTGTGWGASTRTTREEAKTAALKSCNNANKRRKCVFAGSWCSN